MRIHISTDGLGANQSLQELTGSGPTDGEFFFEGHFFSLNSDKENCDIWFVIENPQTAEEWKHVRTGQVIYLSAESSYPVNFFYDSPGATDFLAQFNSVYTFHDIYGENVKRDFPFLSWWINSNHGSVLSSNNRDYPWLLDAAAPNKTAELSVFCSEKSFTPFHRLRLRFVRQLKDHFGDRLVWYGNGIRQLAQKWDGLAPYKYSIVIENQISSLLLSEKLLDPFLTFTFPFYVGAPEAVDIFGEGALTPLEIRDPANAIRVIESHLSADNWSTSLAAISKARDIVLDRFHLLRRIAQIAEQVGFGQRQEGVTRQIYQREGFINKKRIGPARLVARKAGYRLIEFAEGDKKLW